MNIAFGISRIGNRDVRRNLRMQRSIWWEVGRGGCVG